MLGTLAGSEVRLNFAGELVLRCWQELPQIYPRVLLDVLQIMLDHLHGILLLCDAALLRGDQHEHPERDNVALSRVLQSFKSKSAVLINRQAGTSGPVWQQGCMERVIRNDAELEKFRYYIETNPQRAQLKR